MPASSKMVKAGVPLKVAERYRKVRWQMTAGLKRRVRQDVN